MRKCKLCARPVPEGKWFCERHKAKIQSAFNKAASAGAFILVLIGLRKKEK